jgi:hypothetical protein
MSSRGLHLVACCGLLTACSGLLGYDELGFGTMNDASVDGLGHAGASAGASGDEAGAGSGGVPSSGGQAGGAQGGSAGQGAGGAQAGSAGSPGPPPTNRYGIGYVSEGTTIDHDLAAALSGPGGHVLVIFSDIHPGRHSAEPAWKEAISELYARDLVPVIRMAPPWDNRNVRGMGETPTSYKALAQSYVDVLQQLPMRDNWPLYVHVHNEPNLCYEWVCDGTGWLDETALATEYAHMLADVADAVHAMGDSRIRVTNGALSPGSVLSCECSGGGYTAGTTALTYLQKMLQAVPDVFEKIDVFASHSYPSEGEGWAFFPAYEQAGPGLKFFEKELQAIGKPDLKVLISETGWATEGDGHIWSREQVAQFTLQAWQDLWLKHPAILAVTPFMLRDAAWDKFAWADPAGGPYPVYSTVRSFRCSQPGAKNCD